MKGIDTHILICFLVGDDEIQAKKIYNIFKFVNSGLKSKYDLSDLLITHSTEEQGCESVIIFDKKASKFDLFELAGRITPNIKYDSPYSLKNSIQ